MGVQAQSEPVELRKRLDAFVSRIGEAFYPEGATCIVCGRELDGRESGYCEECAALLPYRTGEYCPHCGLETEEGVCFNCMRERYVFDALYAPFSYEQPIRSLVLRMKKGEGWLARYFGEVIALYAQLMECEGDGVVFVPAHLSKRLRTGVDHARLLARFFAKKFDLPLLRGVLKRGNPLGQKRRGKARRKGGMLGVYQAGKRGRKVAGKRIFLVDDIVSTGTTANECARILKELGAVSVTVLCIAR